MPRGKELLRAPRAAQRDGASARKPERNADVVRGRGVAYVKYELVRTYVGAVADVEVNRKTGEITVTRFYVAHDCGQIINPDGLRNQIEGNVVQTVSRTLKEELTFDRSTVTSLDWASYPILTFPEVPDVVIDLIDRPSEARGARGEPTGGNRAGGDRAMRCSTRPVCAFARCRSRQRRSRPRSAPHDIVRCRELGQGAHQFQEGHRLNTTG